jgi:hypothetical protein
MMSAIERMNIAEFRSEGYLQEVNRRFFHPLGLALEISVDADGAESLGGVWDYRDDPEGMFYDGVMSVDKANHITQLEDARREARRDALGYWVQPIVDED